MRRPPAAPGRPWTPQAMDIEWRLRDAFTAVGESVDADSIRGLPWPASSPARGRARRPPRAPWPGALRPDASRLREQLLIPLAAATAVAVIAVTMTVALPRFLPGQRPAGSGGITGVRRYDRALGGPGPRYFVGLRQPRGDRPAAAGLEVYSAVTGRAVASVKPPGRDRWFQAVASFGSDRTFVAAATPAPGANRCSTWFYRFSLGTGGRPVGVVPLSARTVPGVVTGNSALAASANGKVVAYATQDCATPVPAVRLGVINVASGTGSAWTTRSVPRDLSLSADGALLSFVAAAGTGPASGPHADAAWIMRTSAPPGPLARRYRKALHAPGGVPAAALSADGSLLFAITGNGPPNRLVAETVAGYEASTGTLLVLVHVLAAGRAVPAGLSVSASGRFALVYLLRPGTVQELNLVTRQLRTVPLAVSGSPIAAVW